MTSLSGKLLGPYKIGAVIGAGGMGEVYRATDTNLKREVAIKVLPEALAGDADRLARFQREAELLASLNHTNIAHIHGLEKADGTIGLVMELVEGPTLADRISQGPIPADQALNIAMQIADGLEAAHARGIVHRDLKPANIKLRSDGVVKVLDFGIAKALANPETQSLPESPMLTTPAMTQAGIILGTAAYMSPEQARGMPVDERADIWAFGCVLYEMLTGQQAFAGEDVATTLARIIANESDLSSLPDSISPAVRHTIRLCLEKDIRRRVADIRDVRLALKGGFEPEVSPLVSGSQAKPSIGRRSIPVAAGLLAGALIVGLLGWTFWPGSGSRNVNRFTYQLPGDQGFAFANVHVIDISSDGRLILYRGADGIRLRDMASLDDRLIPNADVLFEPRFSPDGKSIAYFTADGVIKRIAVTGGASVIVSQAMIGNSVASLSWADDGSILFADPTGIVRVSAAGGTPEVVVPGAGEFVYGPQLLPDGDTVLFTTFSAGGALDSGQIVAQSISTGERTLIIGGANDGRYLPTGHIVYAFGDSLFGVAFDVARKQVMGGAVPLVQGISRANGGNPGAQFAVADDGTLVYVRGLGVGYAGRTLVWVDREGHEEPIDVPRRNYQYVDLSPDDTRIALDIRDQENDAWVWDLDRQTLQRLTFDPGANRGAVWSPDGQRIAFSRQLDDGEEIYWQAADGSGVAEALTEGSGGPMFPVDFTPDGAALLYTKSDLPRDIFMIPVAGPAGAGTPLLTGSASQGSPTVSPDGRWLAYSSDESGSYEIYVRPFPEVDTGRWQVSTGGGIHPHWSSDGSELFYLVVDGVSVNMMTVPLETAATFRPGTPMPLFTGNYAFLALQAGPDVFDVTSDGQRFLMMSETLADDAGARPDIVIVQNWFEELERLVPRE